MHFADFLLHFWYKSDLFLPLWIGSMKCALPLPPRGSVSVMKARDDISMIPVSNLTLEISLAQPGARFTWRLARLLLNLIANR